MAKFNSGFVLVPIVATDDGGMALDYAKAQAGVMLRSLTVPKDYAGMGGALGYALFAYDKVLNDLTVQTVVTCGGAPSMIPVGEILPVLMSAESDTLLSILNRSAKRYWEEFFSGDAIAIADIRLHGERTKGG